MDKKEQGKRKKLDRPVLAEGEVTGHSHMLVDPSVEVWENEDGTREFNLDKPTALVHEEHGTVVIPAGDKVADRVQMWSYAEEEAEKVKD